MRLSKLLSEAGIDSTPRQGDPEIDCIAIDSRACKPGCCFVAVRGWRQDGHQYIGQAVQAGAVAVISECADVDFHQVAHAVVSDTHEAVGLLAQALKGWPARSLTAAGITGTNGKTTVAFLLQDILTRAKHPTALLGTISYQTGAKAEPSTVTTPDGIALARLTDEMVASGATHLVMEVSSHALDQRRISGIELAVGVFTNLSGDHLDYHQTMSNYALAKQRLFEDLPADATAVLNRDDPVSEGMASATEAKVFWYGLSPAADLWAKITSIGVGGTEFVLVYGEQQIPVSTPLIGRHNVLNSLAAAGAGLALGVDLPTIATSLADIRRIPGRLERVGRSEGRHVFVDYAHTDDALDNVLSSLRPLLQGRIIVAFGCGGDRDRSKRPRMGRIAADLADVAIVTTDNPRSEEPDRIIADILDGLDDRARENVIVQPDRRRAIAQAIEMARGDDVVLIAGKGHETDQLIGGQRIHFDDREVAEELLKQWETSE